jgi:hypothetical protein
MLGLVAVKVSPEHAAARRRFACAVLLFERDVRGPITSARMAVTRRPTRIERRLRPNRFRRPVALHRFHRPPADRA